MGSCEDNEFHPRQSQFRNLTLNPSVHVCVHACAYEESRIEAFQAVSVHIAYRHTHRQALLKKLM